MNARTYNKSVMRNENRRAILQLLHTESLSRAQLSKRSKLTQAAVSSIVEKLIADGIVIEVGKAEQTQSGRKPIMLEINPDWGCAIGINIDHDGFDVGLLDIKGNLISQPIALPYCDDVQVALDEICRAANTLIDKNKNKALRIIGVGAIVPGPVDAQKGQILNPPGFHAWHYLNLKDELSKRLPYNVFICHNANALARAEHSFGKGSYYDSFALLIVNAGIGLGLMLNGQIYTRASGLGCELGHTSINMFGPPCTCGNTGCLEGYASTAAILYDVHKYRSDIDTWEAFVDAAEAGDDFCLRIMDMQAKYLSHALINLNNLLELDAIIITGLVQYKGEMLRSRIEKYLSASNLSKQNKPIEICLSSIAKNAAVIAAGAVVTDKLFLEDLYSCYVENDDML